MGLVPKSTKSEIKVFHGFTLTKLLGMVISGGLGYMFGIVLPYAWLQLIMSAFFIVVYFILSGKAPTNPKYSFAKGLAFLIGFIFSKKKLYGCSSEEYLDMCERRKQKNAHKNKRKEAM